jgi:anti-sigma factor RsiW
MTCREFADFILDYLAGTLDPGVSAVFERHLNVCPNCCEYLAQYRRTVGLVRVAFDDDCASVAKYGIPDELVAAILAASSK